MILAAGWAVERVRICCAAHQLLEFGSAVIACVFEDRHNFRLAGRHNFVESKNELGYGYATQKFPSL
jgi:hypothetical protein